VVRFREKLYYDAFCDAAKKAIDLYCLEHAKVPEEPQQPQEPVPVKGECPF